MNYVILNGKKSLEIQGLLIQSLPPISKPLMRSQIDEIDGRDGDIITKLGFKAYDRPVKIGLTRFYNIDDVIEFFNSEGEVVFSNEPYKKYKYTILQQINFERLIRFRQATVQFHCQPFKHSTVEFPLEFGAEAVTEAIAIKNEGNYISKPTMTIYGSGNITIWVNGVQILTIELGSEGYITIDAQEMEAFKGSVLKNRLVTGNYDNLALQQGRNLLSFTGNVTKVVIEKYSRWI